MTIFITAHLIILNSTNTAAESVPDLTSSCKKTTLGQGSGTMFLFKWCGPVAKKQTCVFGGREGVLLSHTFCLQHNGIKNKTKCKGKTRKAAAAAATGD